MKTTNQNRRDFIKLTGALGASLGLSGLGCSSEKSLAKISADTLGWRLGVQTYTFRDFTLFEAIDKTASVGLKHIEAIYFGQKISNNHNESLKPGMSPKVMKALKTKLSDSDVKMTGYFANKNEVFDRKLFDFCKEFEVEMIVSEPPADTLDDIEKLCEEYKMDLALANHPKGSSEYWSPESVLKACKGRSKRIGASGDIRHWAYEGLNPLECVKMLEGRLLAFHFRDMNLVTGKDIYDVPIGTGASDIRGILEEVQRQGATPAFMIEYVTRFNMENLAQSVAYYNKTVAELIAKK